MATDGDTLQNGDGQVLDPNLDVDIDEYVRRRRLKSIFESRDAVYRILPQARLEQVQGNLGERQRAAIYTEAVQSYLENVEDTILKLEGADELLEADPVGSWQLTPPGYAGQAELRSVEGLHSVEIDGETMQATAVGLQSVMDSEAEFSLRWRVVESHHLKADEVRHKRSHHAFPERIARKAFRMANRFLDDAGLNYQPQVDNEIYEGKYEDLLDGDMDV